IGGAHSLNLAAQDNLRAAGQLRPHFIDDACNVPGYAAQIAALHRSEDVDDWHDVVVRDNGHSGSALDGSDGREKGRCDARSGSRDGHVGAVWKLPPSEIKTFCATAEPL